MGRSLGPAVFVDPDEHVGDVVCFVCQGFDHTGVAFVVLTDEVGEYCECYLIDVHDARPWVWWADHGHPGIFVT